MTKDIISLIHDITQAGYEVKFCGDFNGMVRLEFYYEYDSDYYEHHHLNFPDGPMEKLEKEVVKNLYNFKRNNVTHD